MTGRHGRLGFGRGRLILGLFRRRFGRRLLAVTLVVHGPVLDELGLVKLHALAQIRHLLAQPVVVRLVLLHLPPKL